MLQAQAHGNSVYQLPVPATENVLGPDADGTHSFVLPRNEFPPTAVELILVWELPPVQMLSQKLSARNTAHRPSHRFEKQSSSLPRAALQAHCACWHEDRLWLSSIVSAR